MNTSLVIYEEEFERIKHLLNTLRMDASAKIVFLVDKNGQQIAGAGEVDSVDTTSLASLTAGNVAATDGLAKLIGEKEFSILFHEGRKDNIHISIVGKRLILVVIFDERSSLGLVRLRVRKASADIERGTLVGARRGGGGRGTVFNGGITVFRADRTLSGESPSWRRASGGGGCVAAGRRGER